MTWFSNWRSKCHSRFGRQSVKVHGMDVNLIGQVIYAHPSTFFRNSFNWNIACIFSTFSSSLIIRNARLPWFWAIRELAKLRFYVLAIRHWPGLQPVIATAVLPVLWCKIRTSCKTGCNPKLTSGLLFLKRWAACQNPVSLSLRTYKAVHGKSTRP